MSPLPRSFFERHHLEVARDLLGSELVIGDCAGRVVETEGYGYENDPACHTAFRNQAREFIASNPPGTAYCYLNYGIHWLLNVLAADGIVLVRALEPTEGLELMRSRRGRSRETDLCSGPGKLGQALGLDRRSHGLDLAGGDPTFTFRASPRDEPLSIKLGARIGITKAADFPWRFWVADNPHVSRAR